MKIGQSLLGWLFVLVLQHAGAATLEVGRATVELPGDQWQMLTTYETSLKITGRDGVHAIPMQNAVLFLADPGKTPRALLTITSVERSNRASVNWMSMVCPQPRPKYFTEHFGNNVQKIGYECLIVNSAFAPYAYFKSETEVPKALEAQGMDLFKAGFSMRSAHGSRSGTFMRVHLLTQKNFAGLTQAPTSTQNTYDVPIELINWGLALHEAVKESVNSLSGKLVIPPIKFKD